MRKFLSSAARLVTHMERIDPPTGPVISVGPRAGKQLKQQDNYHSTDIFANTV